jgi:hypothetical protein
MNEDRELTPSEEAELGELLERLAEQIRSATREIQARTAALEEINVLERMWRC